MTVDVDNVSEPAAGDVVLLDAQAARVRRLQVELELEIAERRAWTRRWGEALAESLDLASELALAKAWGAALVDELEATAALAADALDERDRLAELVVAKVRAVAAAAPDPGAPWRPRHGEDVWYEPTPGARFAGVVVGPGTLPNTLRVRLGRAYWYFKRRDGNEAAAVPIDRLSPRRSDRG